MKVITGDITEIEADAIVNAANTELQNTGGVAAAIVEVGGEEIQEECNEIGFCPIGTAVETTAGNLPAEYVIHVPTIDYTSGRKATLEDIYRGAKSALKKAEELGLTSIVFPLLGAGVVGLPEDEIKTQIETAANKFPDIETILCLSE